uniref:NADH-ubiquinone oxidoreductase chain 4 n=1 Tax=Eumeta variegata TaxID=1368026 RepID=A0A410SP19_9NEOP|nr:NADH dehydrogenase subunit 4 [Eumeta variegata]QAT97931.1 NADH dehydrogenase subunit 4 [Eumeta variegata]QOX09146.1 NADH dehydrogenase subunit 4 [Eumeta variegata]
MMKFLMMMFFMIPLCFLNTYWLIQMFLFMMFFMFMNLSLSLNFFSNLSLNLGCDMISYGLIILSLWICALMIMASESLLKLNFYYGFFLFIILFLLLMLYLTFSSLNLFMFYLFFEGSLIPTLFLIIGWGYRIERIQAGIYLLFYTLFASLPMLLGIFYIFEDMDCILIYYMKFNNQDFLFLYLSMILAFLVKMPMFFVHLWLPKAHVEASISGSMILAGLLLKMGGYGILRVMVMFQCMGVKYSVIWIIIGLIGGLYISIICFFQIDMKSLIAYSSVCHMGLVLGGMMTLNYWGFVGSYLLMIGHGLCSSGLFCLVNINYERFFSRSLYISKGMMNIMPSLSLWWFLLLISNMSAPPSLNLGGEISLLNSIMSWSFYLIFILMMIMFFSAGYSLYLYSYSQHGNYYQGMYSFYMGLSREYLLLFLHWFPLNMLILKMDYVMIWF